MIPACRHCCQHYWRYRRDFPPSGFCSLLCAEAFRTKRYIGEESDPGIPAAILELIYSHRRVIHQTDSVLTWFDCDHCERLEEQYGRSLEWHTNKITAEIAQAAPSPTIQEHIYESLPSPASRPRKPHSRAPGSDLRQRCYRAKNVG